MAITFDNTVSVGNVIQIVLMLGAIMGGWGKMRADQQVAKVDSDAKFRATAVAIENLSAATAKDISAVTEAQKLLTQSVAVLQTVISREQLQDERIQMLVATVEELKHGRGFIAPHSAR